ncbi:laccase domain-containing protein, partial [Klebsiella pneumoniae]|nr:laccase domain-containing protein [Klebsiella pneumoniae]
MFYVQKTLHIKDWYMEFVQGLPQGVF